MRSLLIILILLFCTTTVNAATTRNVKYTVNGKEYQGYLASPSPDAPLVLIIHDWDGLTDYEVRRADMLAELGYNAFAADLFGTGVRPTSVEDRKRLTGALYQDRHTLRVLLDAGLAAARDNGVTSRKVVAAGYCFGGAAVLEMARSGSDLLGFVSFHGGLTTPEGQNYGKTRGQILILHGTADESVTMQDFATLAQDLEKQHIRHEMISYSGAPHAFTVFGSERYREDADRKSWQRFTEFLIEVFK